MRAYQRGSRRPPPRAAAAVAAESAAAAAKAAFGLGTRFVDRERAATHLELVELGRRLLRFFVGRHLDEREAARPTRGRVAHDAHRFDVPRSAEQLLQLRFARRVGKIPDV